jgi:hypothetical protein
MRLYIANASVCIGKIQQQQAHHVCEMVCTISRQLSASARPSFAVSKEFGSLYFCRSAVMVSMLLRVVTNTHNSESNLMAKAGRLFVRQQEQEEEEEQDETTAAEGAHSQQKF